jgi:hypothetical protein
VAKERIKELNQKVELGLMDWREGKFKSKHAAAAAHGNWNSSINF